jgi:tetratricopeptide (TPR) repeat protein/glycosyltransferase involved in cell wall biosynthesis
MKNTSKDLADQQNEEGIQWLYKKQFDKSLNCFEKAVQLDPQHAYAICNMGRIYYEKGQFEKAVQYFEKAISIHPKLPETHSNLGLTWHRLNQMDNAIASYHRALEINPDYAIACYNMGFTLEKLGRLTESTQWYEKALAIDPNYIHAHSNLAMTLLLAGDYKRGFMEYEWRLKHDDAEPRDFSSTLWDGQSFYNKRLLIYPEQGYGDSIQFIRYLPEVKKRGGSVILETHKYLVPLFKDLPYIDNFVIHGDPSPPVDYHIAIASLPHVFETTIETIPCSIPYLYRPEKEKSILVQTIEMMDGFRVGISWAGSPIHKNDKNRSCSLSLFYQLTQIKGVVLFSIQKGPACDDIRKSDRMPVVDLCDLIDDFSDTATAIFHMDLIISVDTATAHLAGAMGIPTWIIIPYEPDWRWMRDRHDSPWYPSIRLFRQPKAGDFDHVMQDIQHALIDLINHPNSLDYLAQFNKTAIHLFNQRRLDDSIHTYKRLLDISPDSDFLHSNLGIVYLEKNLLDQALQEFKIAQKLAPENSTIYRLLGNVYRRYGQFDYAMENYNKALEINPNDTNLYNEIGTLNEKSANLDEAIKNYNKAIALKPDQAESYRNLAHAYFMKGLLKEGFKYYEWRLKCADYKSRVYHEIPMWKGERFEGKTLFLCTEQGFGDIIQFIRYAPMVKSLGGTVAFGTFPIMLRLISKVKGVDRVFDKEPMRHFAYQIPLMSLPSIFKTDIDTIPINIPYIYPPDNVGDWISIVRDHPAKLKIGISWAGSLKHPEDHLRSMPLETLQPLLRLSQTDDIAFFSLQIGERALTAADGHLPIIDLNPHVNDFADTAAAIEKMDLVISVDTSTVHLAGAMGKPVWLMLPVSPDWRWMRDRKDSPWYPTMSIFRQKEVGDWATVVNNIVESLSIEAARNGDLFIDKDQLEQAESWYKLSIKIDPRYATAYTNIGVIYEKRKLIDRAIEWYRQSLYLDPENAPTHKNLGHALLLKGQFIEGFKEYQWRLKCKKFLDDPQHDINIWQGQPLENKTILLYSEQGFGDIIQFVRYAPFLKARGAKTVVGTFPNLTRLLKTADGVDRSVSNAFEKEFDFQIHLLSLPHLFGTHEQNIPSKVPYFNIDASDVDKFASIIDASEDHVHLGLIWKGDPNHPNDKNRSISFETLFPLLEVSGIRFYCFQKDCQKDIEKVKNITDLSPHIQDFYDTAAAMMCMDAIISVDTAPAHLAGALGKPVYLLLPFVPDWRWMLDCSKSPWYPSMKLLRQEQSKTWQPVISNLLSNLAKIFCDKGDELLRLKKYDLALAMYQQSLKQDGSYVQSINNMGVALQNLNQFDDARLHFEKALQINPYHKEAWNNLGSILFLLRKTDESFAPLQQAIFLSKDYAEAHFNLAQCLLQKAVESYQAHAKQQSFSLDSQGPKLDDYPFANNDFQNGFKAYEWRWQSNQFPCKIQPMPGKKWTGEKLTDKKLLLVSEQGFGDILFFIRYLPQIPKCHLILLTHKEMLPLLNDFPGIDQIITDGDLIPEIDYYIPSGSLPHVLMQEIKCIVLDKPYLNSSLTMCDDIQRQINSYKDMTKVGLVWASGGTHQHMDKRTYGLEYFSALFELDNVHFFSLQKGPRANDLKDYPDAPVTDMQEYIHNFKDTAAIISQMDLVISTDTAVAHLAGAMGRDIWVALPYSSGWPWGQTGTKSCWYKNMRLFRQEQPEGYNNVVQKIKALLKNQISANKNENISDVNQIQKRPQKYLVHGIGYIQGHTGYNIHTSNFFAQLKRFVPFVQTDLQAPERTRIETDTALNTCKDPILNIAITYGNKMNMLQPCPGIRIGYTVWESTRLPDDWMEPLKIPDQLWTPSSFCKQVLENHGFDSKKISVVPEGIDPEIFHPNVNPLPGSENIKGFKFLNVGKYEERKCTPYMIRAFDEEFKDTKDVVLILSCHNPFEKGFDIRKKLKRLNLKCPEKILLINPVREHQSVAQLYASCDAFLFPTRAEGWGLPIIEALACGLPTIVTNYSGQTEYLTEEMAYLLDYEFEDINIPFFLSKDNYYGKWARPDMNQFRYYLRYIYENQDEARQKGLNAAKLVHEQWTWEHAAKIAVNEIEQLLQQLS